MFWDSGRRFPPNIYIYIYRRVKIRFGWLYDDGGKQAAFRARNALWISLTSVKWANELDSKI